MFVVGQTSECSVEEHKQLVDLVRKGKLFELMDWVREGRPTLIPYEKNVRRSLIIESARIGNHSMVTFLWEQAYQHAWEVERLLGAVIWENQPASVDLAKYFIKQGLPVEDVCASDIFVTHDDELIRLALKRGLDYRSGDGFAGALWSTGCSKHLLRLYKELKDDYPDMITEVHIALRDAVEQGRLRSSALLVWVGVDPFKKLPDDPYEDLDEEDCYCYSAFDRIRLDEKTRGMLKAMKIEITPDVWFHFFKTASWLRPEDAPDVFQWVPDGHKLIKDHPDKSAEVFEAALGHLSSDWDSRYNSVDREKRCLLIAEYIAYLGIPCLNSLVEPWHYRSLRESCYDVEKTKYLVRVFWVMYERGDAEQRDKLRELVRMPKMQAIIKDHDPQLVRDLGIGTKRQLEYRTDPENRPWNLETYQPPCLFKG